MADSGGPNTPWAWLGLLKWSLSYTDGTSPSGEAFQPMSDEDKAFLESVMKDGIIDEGERMKTILSDMTAALEQMRNHFDIEGSKSQGDVEDTKNDFPDMKEEDIVELLHELQDIVEQIDYARAFSAMGGLQFLLGCASERDVVPCAIRSSCLGVLATLCQNNPPVQDSMLNQNSARILADLYFSELLPEGVGVNEPDGVLLGKVVQAMSCSIREHAAAEEGFCNEVYGRRVIELGLGLHSRNEMVAKPPTTLRKRCLFFLYALVTSDTSSIGRVKSFEPCIKHLACNFLDPSLETEFEIREMALQLLDQLMKQKRMIDMTVEMKGKIVGLGIRRIKEIREMEGEDREFAQVELDLWESLIVEVARIGALLGHGEDAHAPTEISNPPSLLEG